MQYKYKQYIHMNNQQGIIIKDSTVKIKINTNMAKKNLGGIIIKDTTYNFKSGTTTTDNVKLSKVYKPTSENERLLRSFLKTNNKSQN